MAEVQNSPVTANAPPMEPTQDMAVGSQLQAPAPQPAPQKPLALSPSATSVAPHESFAGKLFHAIRASFPGAQDMITMTDTAGKITTKPNPNTSPGSFWRNMIAGALTGLAAGTVAGRENPNAPALAGLGAGAQAEKEALQKKRGQQRQEASESFEREQKVILQRHEIAKGNVLTYRNMLEAQKLEIDLDPARQAGQAMWSAAETANISGRAMMTADEAAARLEKDPTFVHDNIILPAGFGKPEQASVTGETKQGKGMVVVIPAKEGKIELPAAYLSEAQKYAKLSGRTDLVDQLKTGHSLDVRQLPALNGAIEEGRRRWLDGEAKPQLVFDAGDKPSLINSATGDAVSYLKPGMVPSAAKEISSKEELRAAQADVAEAKGRQALAEATLAINQYNLLTNGTPEEKAGALDSLMKSYSNLPPIARGYLLNLNPALQSQILGLWSGQTDPKSFPTAIRKGTGQMSRTQMEGIVQQMDPTWNESKFDIVKKTNIDFTGGKEGQSIRSFGQFIRHAAEAVQISNSAGMVGSPLFDKPLNWLKTQGFGDTYVSKIQPAITTALDEWATFIKSGHAETEAESAAKNALASPASTPRQIHAAFSTMGNTAVDRLDQINETYRTVTSVNYPNLVPPSVMRDSKILGLDRRLQGYGSGGTLFSGPSPVRGAPGTQPQVPPDAKFAGKDASGNVVGYVNAQGQWVSLQK